MAKTHDYYHQDHHHHHHHLHQHHHYLHHHHHHYYHIIIIIIEDLRAVGRLSYKLGVCVTVCYPKCLREDLSTGLENREGMTETF
jgi:hypothetical protein